MDKNEIITAAFGVLSEVGLDGLTTRRLALALNVKGPALYYHYHNKFELLGDMANTLVAQALIDLEPQLEWTVWCLKFARRIRSAVLVYPDGARLLTTAWPTEAMRDRTIPMIEEPLRAAGFTTREAHEGVFLIASTVIGWMMNEQNNRIRQLIGDSTDLDAAFDRAIGTIIAGLRAGLDDRRSSVRANLLAVDDK